MPAGTAGAKPEPAANDQGRTVAIHHADLWFTVLTEHFYANHTWSFVLAALLPPVDAVDTLLKGVPHLLAQGPLYVATLLIVTGLSLVGARTKRAWFHAAFAVFFFITMLVSISINCAC